MSTFTTRTASDLVNAARQQIGEVDPAALAREMSAPPVLIDVREPAEFASGHLPGAINIPRGVLEFQVEAHPALPDANTWAKVTEKRKWLETSAGVADAESRVDPSRGPSPLP